MIAFLKTNKNYFKIYNKNIKDLEKLDILNTDNNIHCLLRILYYFEKKYNGINTNNINEFC